MCVATAAQATPQHVQGSGAQSNVRATAHFLEGKPFTLALVRSVPQALGGLLAAGRDAAAFCVPPGPQVPPRVHVGVLVQLPGQGRGLVATEDIAAGAPLFCEAPLACAPLRSLAALLCAHCLAPLDHGAPASDELQIRGSAAHAPLCAACAAASLSSPQPRSEYAWLEAYRALDSSAVAALQAWCHSAGQQAPLLALRLACAEMMASHEGAADRDETPGSTVSRGAEPPRAVSPCVWCSVWHQLFDHRRRQNHMLSVSRA